MRDRRLGHCFLLIGAAFLSELSGARVAAEPVFIPNAGQWDRAARFLLRSPGLDAWICDEGVVLDIYRYESLLPDGSGDWGEDSGDSGSTASPVEQRLRRSSRRRIGHVVRLSWWEHVGGAALAGGVAPAVVNYLRADQASDQWVGLPTYQDLSMVASARSGRASVALPLAAKAQIDGADGIVPVADGSLLAQTTMGSLFFDTNGTIGWIGAEGLRKPALQLRPGEIGFQVSAAERLDPTRRWVEPMLFSTFLGGTHDESLGPVAVDGRGDIYIVAETESADFPTTLGAYQRTFDDGDRDVVVSKLSADGRRLLYSTFLGGSGADFGFDLAVNVAGEVYVTGGTNSPDFPTTRLAYDRTPNGGNDVFVSKLSADGSQLMLSTLLGGSSIPSFGNQVLAGDYALSIELDFAGRIVLAGSTTSDDFPVTSDAMQAAFGGVDFDGFVTVFDASATRIIYSTYVGGSAFDVAWNVAADRFGHVFLTGYTESADFPVTPGAFDIDYGGGRDGFVVRIGSDRTRPEYATFLGGSRLDHLYTLQVNVAGEAIVGGFTQSADFPTTAGAWDRSHNGGGDVVVSCLSADGGRLVYSTLLGGSSDDALQVDAMRLDHFGNIVFAGWTRSRNFPLAGPALDRTYASQFDAFAAKLDADGERLLYSTFLGGRADDWAWGVELEPCGDVILRGTTTSVDFPVSPAALNRTPPQQSPSEVDVFVTRLRFFPGDLNHDDRVDLDDYRAWHAALADAEGAGADGCRPEDVDGDGVVDLVDFALLQRGFEIE